MYWDVVPSQTWYIWGVLVVQLAGGVKVVVREPRFVMVVPHYAFKRAALIHLRFQPQSR